MVSVWRAVKPIKLWRESRKRRRRRKKLVEEDSGVTKYNKAIGMLIGGLIGVLVTRFPVLDFLGHPVLVDQATIMVTGLLGTYFAPKNSQ